MTSLVKTEAGYGLDGARILVVEDDFLLLLELEEVLHDAGAVTVESCRTISAALQIAESDEIAAAVLDVRIGKDSIVPVARQLSSRRIPFVFYTGQVGNDRMIAEWPRCRIVSKPALPHMIVGAVADLLKQQAAA